MSFQFLALYTGDYRRDTQHLSMMEHGCYLLMLMHSWDQRGPLPLDERRIFAICNARSNEEMGAARNVLGEFFVRMGDGHYNRRMQREIERADAISGARSNAGKLGGVAKAKQLPSKCQAIAKQVPLPLPLPPPLQQQTPKDGEDSGAPQVPPPAREVDVEGRKPTSAGLLCRAIKAAGVADVNPGHPDLLRLMAGQIPDETWTATAAELVGKGRGKFALLMRTVEGRWNDAQAAGPVAAAAVADPWETRAGVDSVAKKIGLQAWDECCEWSVFKARVKSEFDRTQKRAAA